MSDTRKQQLLTEVAEVIDRQKQSRESAKEIIAKAQKKSHAEKPKNRALISILTVSMLVVGGSLSWAQSEKIADNHNYQALQLLKEENERLVAARAATDAVENNLKSIELNTLKSNFSNCDGAISNLTQESGYCFSSVSDSIAL